MGVAETDIEDWGSFIKDLHMNTCEINDGYLYIYNTNTKTIHKHRVTVSLNPRTMIPVAKNVVTNKIYRNLPLETDSFWLNSVIYDREIDWRAAEILMLHYMDREDELVEEHVKAHEHAMALMNHKTFVED